LSSTLEIGPEKVLAIFEDNPPVAAATPGPSTFGRTFSATEGRLDSALVIALATLCSIVPAVAARCSIGAELPRIKA